MMVQQNLQYEDRWGYASTVLYWGCLLVAAIGLTATLVYFEAGRLTQGMSLEEMFSYQVISYGNLLLTGSTVLYVCHLRFTSDTVGRWASGLATAGALGVAVALLIRWFETSQVLPDAHAPITTLYEVTALFSAITVVIYLAMERAYRTRSAGAFVMPIVLGAILFEIWLVSSDQAVPGKLSPALKSYWMHAHILAHFVSYGAFAVAASMGAMYLFRHHAESRAKGGFALRSLPDLPRIDSLMHNAILLGFPLFTLAMILGIAWGYQAWGRYWSWEPKETWALIVWLTYASYLYCRHTNKWDGKRMAWWAIVGFGITVFCFLGVSLLWAGQHSHGQASW